MLTVYIYYSLFSSTLMFEIHQTFFLTSNCRKVKRLKPMWLNPSKLEGKAHWTSFFQAHSVCRAPLLWFLLSLMSVEGIGATSSTSWSESHVFQVDFMPQSNGCGLFEKTKIKTSPCFHLPYLIFKSPFGAGQSPMWNLRWGEQGDLGKPFT